VLTTVAYVFVFGGELADPARLLFGALALGLGLVTVYLLYRFVVAVEKIADKL
jgi:hypothetical protein